MPDRAETPCLVLCDDLIFSSRITGTGEALGLPARVARTPAQLEQLARAQPPACVIVDLHCPGLDITALVPRLREGRGAMPFIVGYGSHVDVATLRRAREAGCDLVLPRSQFVEDLPRELPRWCSRAEV